MATGAGLTQCAPQSSEQRALGFLLLLMIVYAVGLLGCGDAGKSTWAPHDTKLQISRVRVSTKKIFVEAKKYDDFEEFIVQLPV